MDIKIDVSRSCLVQGDIDRKREKADEALERLWSGKEDFTGWVKLPMEYDKQELESLLAVSDAIGLQCELLIVIGIGGSYLGAKAAIEALPKEPGAPEVKFAGTNLSAAYHAQLLEEMGRKEVCLCVISKSGTTVETAAAFSIFKKELIRTYGEAEARKRIYVITDPEKGALREEVEKEGYISFSVPSDIGGRYSVLTPVGLLPIAAAGADVKAMLDGAAAAALSTDWDFDAKDYAIARYLLLQKGKVIEGIQYFEPRLKSFVSWMKQLYGESEGKNGTGLFPSGLELTTDLHSIGQFLQQGNQVFFETVLNVMEADVDLTIPSGPLAGKTLNQLNKAAVKGVIQAHSGAQIPMVRIDIPKLDAYHLGQLIYFFETTCALTAMLMEVNPFDQPGVEAYKKEMKKEIS
ncbi:glucose-6-phosphate isomerase [Ihubacter massiliensis]|uniref:Glucose-6-phosphate isomerase n=1 Tax=Hominibacterium faecale TaxID=2839743 RepID=A0A9J6QRS2_9FIRM|nr:MULTISPECIES: glucose-6-phosphate isomerase [Eubacteriales Family XIII. Incertae Sedis]MCO7122966.1 glucose-6-phosphate isomerase [Ihubacter massiliensis]MCU7377227.1 glucose-6-phosphate isomerase [Hominibacterium faecale]